MTAQIPDSVDVRGQGFALVGVAGEGLFDPSQHGFEPVMLHTACWRGFVCAYELGDDGWLRLRQVTARFSEESMQAAGRGQLSLLGRRPRVGNELVFEDLGEVAFTGGLLLGAEFVQELYVHMGYPAAWKFGQLRELVFAAGRLQDELDHSAAAAELRATKRADEAPQGEALGAWFQQQRAGEQAWSQRTFRFEYPG